MEKIETMENTITMTYNGGRGHMTVKLPALFETRQITRVKQILKVVKTSYECDESMEIMTTYAQAQLADVKEKIKETESLVEKYPSYATELKSLKRDKAFLEKVLVSLGIKEKIDSDDTVHFKKGMYYVLSKDGKRETRNGYLFEYKGVHFGICKIINGKNKTWSITELTSGYLCGDGKTRDETVEKLNEFYKIDNKTLVERIKSMIEANPSYYINITLDEIAALNGKTLKNNETDTGKNDNTDTIDETETDETDETENAQGKNENADNAETVEETETPDKTDTDIALEKISSLTEIKIEKCGTWIWITGKTYQHKETLKQAGFRWSRNKQAWYYRGGNSGNYRPTGKRTHDMDYIRSKYGSEHVA